MKSIKVLDCTLRDGGYCNDWNFGASNIKKIISMLNQANIDIIECGFLTNNIRYSQDKTKYSSLKQLLALLKHDSMLCKKSVVMINYGEYDIDQIPKNNGSIFGIRVVFHKNESLKAMKYCEKIIQKGYRCFVQPMLTQQYSDIEFIDLIKIANKINPFAFYIVDSFGSMRQSDLKRYMVLADIFLNTDINLGFHSHNNLQLAFSNSKYFITNSTKKNLIVDCSIYGMGRGAGNLNTELFLNELNLVNDSDNYDVTPILKIMDCILSKFYEEKSWGYSLPNYLSASKMIHPNYANYLFNKRNLEAENINEIFNILDNEKKASFDKEYIERMYMSYMSRNDKLISEDLSKLKHSLKDKKALLIAPGKSVSLERERILSFIKNNNTLVITVNFIPSYIVEDYVFVSNVKRFRQLNISKKDKLICTSNVDLKNADIVVRYSSLINSNSIVKDNACLMLLNLLINKIGINKVYVAGMDGYSHDKSNNYGSNEYSYEASNEYFDLLNSNIKLVIDQSFKDHIETITDSIVIA